MTAEPTFVKVSHTSFSVRDCEHSSRWLAEVFGFVELDRSHGDGWRGIVLLHPPTGTVLEYQQHDAHRGERFDPTRTGLDHVGLMVAERSDLDAWKARFERLGVVHSPIADREYGSVLTFKDPDGIQLEMFYRAGHP